jgi:RNA ligase
MTDYNLLAETYGVDWFLENLPKVSTADVDFNEPKQVMAKMDGSLISAFIHQTSHSRDLWLKTKTSLISQQALDAMAWLNLPENAAFKAAIRELAEIGFTVNMEWISPNNRIVIDYERPELVVLNVRCNITGAYVERRLIKNFGERFGVMLDHWVETLDVSDPVQFVKDVAGMQGVEGFVIELASGQWVKVKAEAYCALHHCKDSVNSPRRLFEAVLEDASDDLKGLFATYPEVISRILAMEELVAKHYGQARRLVESFYHDNKGLSRKVYAIKAQAELGSRYFALAMNLYLGKDVDYKAWMLKSRKDFGVNDTENEE